FIGTELTGTAALGNGAAGVVVDSGAGSNTVGGTAAGARNVIYGNVGSGVVVGQFNTSVTGNVVAGNYIGTDRNGAAAVANTLDGVTIANASTGNTVGGTTAAARNVISGNSVAGVRLSGLSSANHVQGNYLGTDKN